MMSLYASGTKIAANKGLDGVAEHNGKLGIVAANSDDDTAQLSNQYLEMIKKSSEKFEKKLKQNEPAVAEAKEQQEKIVQKRPTSTMPPVNTRVTDVQTRPVAPPTNMPMGGLQERIAQSNQLDQFIPVR